MTNQYGPPGYTPRGATPRQGARPAPPDESFQPNVPAPLPVSSVFGGFAAGADLPAAAASQGPNEYDAFIKQITEAGYVPVPGRPGVYFNPLTKDTLNLADKALGGPGTGSGSGGGGGDGTGMAQVGLGYAQLDENRRQFGLDFDEGRRQFDQTFQRSALESDREYEQRRDQFAQTFAEGKRQFDANEAGENRRFDAGEAGENRRFDASEAGADRRLGVSEAGTDRRFFAGEAGQNSRALLGEQGANSRARLSAQVNAFSSVNTLAPALGNLALDSQRFAADVLSKPSDFIYRAFASRGGQSPTAMVSQADLLNSLRQRFTEINSTLSSFNAGPTSIAGPAFQTAGVAPAPATGVPSPAAAVSSSGTQQGTPDPGIAEFDKSIANAVAAGNTGAVASLTASRDAYRAQQPVVSQQSSQIVPQQQFQATAPVSLPTPQLPVPAAANQAEIVDLARRFSPPAVNSVLEGERPESLRFGFALPTPGLYNSMTPDEKTAFGARIGAEFGSSIDDVEHGIKQRYGTAPSRRARTTAGFSA